MKQLHREAANQRLRSFMQAFSTWLLNCKVVSITTSFSPHQNHHTQYTSKMTTINALPNDCLILIFRHLPLPQLIHAIQLVNHRWSTVHYLVARQVKSLALIGDEVIDASLHRRWLRDGDHSSLPSFYHLKLTTSGLRSPAETSDAICGTFVKINRLELMYFRLQMQLPLVLNLLNGWKPTLTDLTVYFVDGRRSSQSEV